MTRFRPIQFVLFAASWLVWTTRVPTVHAHGWPVVCSPPEMPAAAGARRVFHAQEPASDAACQLVSRANGYLYRDVGRAKSLVQQIAWPLAQAREVRWLKGRIALVEGRALDAFVELRPDDENWPDEPYVLWDLAVAAAAIQENRVAREAYRRVRIAEFRDERLRLAVHLEMAAIESRFGPSGLAAAQAIAAAIELSDTDPDSCPWVDAMQVLLDRLARSTSPRTTGNCSRSTLWARMLQSTYSSGAIFESVPQADAWLRLPRNERLAMLAVGLGSTRAEQRRRLWSTIEAPKGSALSDLVQRELARLAREP